MFLIPKVLDKTSWASVRAADVLQMLSSCEYMLNTNLGESLGQ